jgi:hypothetical protein
MDPRRISEPSIRIFAFFFCRCCIAVKRWDRIEPSSTSISPCGGDAPVPVIVFLMRPFRDRCRAHAVSALHARRESRRPRLRFLSA